MKTFSYFVNSGQYNEYTLQTYHNWKRICSKTFYQIRYI